MITREVQSALIHLQARSSQTLDTFESERIDRALDEILRSPENESPFRFQVRSAIAHATERLKERRTRVTFRSLEHDLEAGSSHPGYVEPDFALVEIASLIDAAPLPAKDRALLHLLAIGENVSTPAGKLGVSEQRMREQISRLRRKAKPLLDPREDAA